MYKENSAEPCGVFSTRMRDRQRTRVVTAAVACVACLTIVGLLLSRSSSILLADSDADRGAGSQPASLLSVSVNWADKNATQKSTVIESIIADEIELNATLVRKEHATG